MFDSIFCHWTIRCIPWNWDCHSYHVNTEQLMHVMWFTILWISLSFSIDLFLYSSAMHCMFLCIFPLTRLLISARDGTSPTWSNQSTDDVTGISMTDQSESTSVRCKLCIIFASSIWNMSSAMNHSMHHSMHHRRPIHPMYYPMHFPMHHYFID